MRLLIIALKLKIMKLLTLILAMNLSHSNITSTIVHTKTQRLSAPQNAVRAFLYFQGSFIDGTISVQRTQFGYQPIAYSFAGIANRQTTGQFYPNTQLTPLNPNNTYAVKYNFTHTVNIPNLGTAYVTL